jgi:hypothetical protein
MKMKNMRQILLNLGILALIPISVCGQKTILDDSLNLNVDKNTYWWAGVINDGYKMPFTESYQADFNSNYGNQVQPLMLSSIGEVIWSEQAYKIYYSPGKLSIQGKSAKLQYNKVGESLKDAYNLPAKLTFHLQGKCLMSLCLQTPSITPGSN